MQASSSTLNPNSGNYTVELRYRTTKHFGNIVQKGQAGSSGGYFKIENPNGNLTCVFRGTSSSGKFLRKQVVSPAVLSDGAWHVARCARTATALTLTIDGSVVATAHGSSGNITNNRPISIAGKLNCDQIHDDLRLLHGRHRLHHDLELAIGMGGRPPAGAGGLRRSRSGKLAAFAPRERRAL